MVSFFLFRSIKGIFKHRTIISILDNAKIISVQEYLKNIPETVRPGFEEFRSLILKTAVSAKEGISYGMPSLKYHGMLVYYACHKNHYALYPMKSAIIKFADELAGYETSAGTIRFPHGKKIPKKLIVDIVRFRMKLNLKNATEKKKG